MNRTDVLYKELIRCILDKGDRIETRNNPAISLWNSNKLFFSTTPLVTIRKTAWKKALKEMEWFLSGNPKCPDELLDWWNGQLDPYGNYNFGYGEQLRQFGYQHFDQITSLVEGIYNHPFSRRHILTTWNPYDMNRITEENLNPKTPTTCHGTLSQFFVREGSLHIQTYQRSADVLLGVPHNWIQYRALLLWIAKRTKLHPGYIQWSFGDLHLYDEPSHMQTAYELLTLKNDARCHPRLVYNGQGGEFKADEFEIKGTIDDPISTIRPKLL